MLSHRAGSSGMIDRARGEGSVERKTDYRSIACVGLSALQEQLVDSSLSWLAERESLRFERVELAAAAIVVLDGRSLVAQGVLSTFVQDSTKNFVIIGGSQTFSHPQIHLLNPPLLKRAMAATLIDLCRVSCKKPIVAR